jgi:hypothetical protein
MPGMKKNQPGCPCCEEEEFVDLGCGCATVPTTLYMKATRPDLNGGLFNDATLVYGPNPAPFDSGFGLPGSCHWSEEEFVVGTDTFRYALYCSIGQYRLILATSAGPLAPNIAQRYTWTATGTAGNTCGPFYLLNGVMYVGGDATNKNYVSGTAGDWAIGQKVLSGNCRTSGFVSLVGVAVTCDAVTGISQAVTGDFAFVVAQSASSRGWTAVKSGYTNSTGTVAGQALDAAVPQYAFFNVVMSP